MLGLRQAWAMFLVLSAASANAGINTINFGLPASSAYGVPYESNAASAICVDCHSASPVINDGRRGSHFVAHYDGVTVRTTNNKTWLKIDAWSSGALSKYGSPAPPDSLAASVTGAQGEMICESCHNLITNVAGGNNLVASAVPTSDPTELCQGCHAAQAAGPPAHHPLTGDNVGPDEEQSASHVLTATHASHVLAAPLAGSDVTYSDISGSKGVNCVSCHTAHGGATGAAARILKYGYSASAAYQGLPVNLIYIDGVPQGTDSAGTVKIWDTGESTPGLDRQFDIEATFGPIFRMVTNQDPLCDACHSAP